VPFPLRGPMKTSASRCWSTAIAPSSPRACTAVLTATGKQVTVATLDTSEPVPVTLTAADVTALDLQHDELDAQLFDEFSRDSVIAQQAPDAVNVSEAESARIVVAAERERLFGQTGGVTG
jgi:hypothetical protein